jgi:hypothetical protein
MNTSLPDIYNNYILFRDKETFHHSFSRSKQKYFIYFILKIKIIVNALPLY